MSKIHPEKQWEAVETNVLKAEKQSRKAHKASAEAYKETGLTKKERATVSRDDLLLQSKRRRVAEKAIEHEESAEGQAEEILGSADSPERALVALQRKNLISAIRTKHTLEKVESKLLKEEVEILKDIKGEPYNGLGKLDNLLRYSSVV